MGSGSILVLWDKWNIRGFVMLSLWLQIFLVLFAPLRKKIASWTIISLLWLAYLIADWIAAFAIGLISHSQSNLFARVAEVDGALRAFWASFLLLHLGGPDTITAFSMEDSSLWRRHLLSLVFQVGSAIYVFVQIFPIDKSLVIPTMLVFLAGVIKNAERTAALNFSSLPNLREWVLSQRKHPDDVANKFVKDSIVSQLESSYKKEEKLAESIVVKHAHYFFQMFVVLLGDLMFTLVERKASRDYFRKVSAMDALRVISVELQFMYEVLHTKTLVMRSKWSFIFRFIAFTNVATAFIMFNRLKKHQLPRLDVEITYSLLFGGIALDVIALLMLVFSDWTITGIKQVSFLNKFISASNNLRKPRLATCEAHPNAIATYMALDTRLIFRRWSESISACNLLSEFLKKSPRKMCKRDRCCGIIRDRCCGIIRDRCYGIFRCWGFIRDLLWCIIGIFYFCWKIFSSAKRILSCCISLLFCWPGLLFCLLLDEGPTSFTIPRIANTKYVSKNPFIEELWTFIFTEVRRKSDNADNEIEARKIFEAKGDLFLESGLHGINCSNFSVYVTRVNFDASIIMWHIATEMWYNMEKPFISGNNESEFSKILSDYMMYLLLNQPNLVSTVAGIAQIRSLKVLRQIKDQVGHRTNCKDVEELCKRLYDARLERFGGSELYEGIKLAHDLESLGPMKWKVISGVWVEMLSYAAIHIKGEVHVQVLSKGGELLAFVWLLMAHVGCFYKPEWGIYANYSGFNL